MSLFGTKRRLPPLLWRPNLICFEPKSGVALFLRNCSHLGQVIGHEATGISDPFRVCCG